MEIAISPQSITPCMMAIEPLLVCPTSFKVEQFRVHCKFRFKVVNCNGLLGS